MKKIVDMLTLESVSILTINEEGLRHRCSYMNSLSGREFLNANEPEEVVAEVLSVWGDKPIIEEFIQEDIPMQGEDYKGTPQIDVWDEMAKAIKQGVNEV